MAESWALLQKFVLTLWAPTAVIAVSAILARIGQGRVFWSVDIEKEMRRASRRLDELHGGSHLARLSEQTFCVLQWLSPATWCFGTRAASHDLAQLRREETTRAKFVDTLVVGWCAACVGALLAARNWPGALTAYTTLGLALLRCGDIFQANINAHLWDVARISRPEDDHVKSLQRSLLLTAINYVELIGWSGALYVNFHLARATAAPDARLGMTDAVYFSAVTQLTIGYGDFHPVRWGRALAPLQTMIGTALLLVGVARLISGIKPPTGNSKRDEPESPGPGPV